MLHVREAIPFKLLSIENQPIEGFYIEINLREKMLCNTSNSNRNNIGNHLDFLSKNVAWHHWGSKAPSMIPKLHVPP